MALVFVLLTQLALCALCLCFSALGKVILHGSGIRMASASGKLLLEIAIGLLTTEVLLFVAQNTQRIVPGCAAILAVLAFVLFWQRKAVWEHLRDGLKILLRSSPPVVRLIAIALFIVLAVEFLVAMAPLIGSDALHYHFTAQKQILQSGFHPNFSNAHSFLCGQHHLLILFALALGSEHLAKGLILLGGMLTGASLACLASRWASRKTAAVMVLLFLLTPVVFWQIASSGSPDVYMGFFACTAVLVLQETENPGDWRRLALAGLLVGGIAGAKYTGCIIAAAFCVAAIIEYRSVARLGIFVLGAVLSGVWPYLRNAIWTGDPVFPLLADKLSPHLITR